MIAGADVAVLPPREDQDSRQCHSRAAKEGENVVAGIAALAGHDRSDRARQRWLVPRICGCEDPFASSSCTSRSRWARGALARQAATTVREGEVRGRTTAQSPGSSRASTENKNATHKEKARPGERGPSDQVADQSAQDTAQSARRRSSNSRRGERPEAPQPRRRAAPARACADRRAAAA